MVVVVQDDPRKERRTHAGPFTCFIPHGGRNKRRALWHKGGTKRVTGKVKSVRQRMAHDAERVQVVVGWRGKAESK